MKYLVMFAACAAICGQDSKDRQDVLLKALSKSKLSLADGIRQAVTKDGEISISAKFEMEGDELSLSVYTAEKGLKADAEHNILKELAGNPCGDKWKPETEVFKDVKHVSRSAQQITLMSLSKCTLVDIIEKAQKKQAGIVFSITPVMKDRKGWFVVLVADEGKVVELTFDLDGKMPEK